MENKDQSAFPILETAEYNTVSVGLTKREWFAGMALQGLAGRYIGSGAEELARLSIVAADEILKQLDK